MNNETTWQFLILAATVVFLVTHFADAQMAQIVVFTLLGVLGGYRIGKGTG